MKKFIIFLFISFAFCDNIDKYLTSMKDFNITINEMDKILYCSVVYQLKLDQDESKISEIIKRLNMTKDEELYEKITDEMLEKCFNKVNDNTVSEYFQNLTYIKEIFWQKEYNDYVDIDYNKFQTKKDLELTVNEEIISYKYNKLIQVYQQKKEDEREKIENESKRVRIGKVDLENIPGYIKTILFLVVFGLLFGCCLWFLGSLGKSQKLDKKKKKKTK